MHSELIVLCCCCCFFLWETFESSRTLKISSFNKIPRLVPSQISYTRGPVPQSQGSWNKDGVGRRNRAWCCICTALFFPFSESKKKTKTGAADEEEDGSGLIVAEKDGAMPRTMEFVIFLLADRHGADLALRSRVFKLDYFLHLRCGEFDG